MLYYVMKMLSKLVCLLPYKIINYIGDIIGGLTWYLVPKKRKHMAKQNIMLALNKNEVAAEIIAKKSWTRFGAMIMEVLYFPKIKQDINKYVEIQGREYLDEALKQGKGIVLATAHSSNWELLGGGLALNGYQIVGVAQKQTNGSMDKFINEGITSKVALVMAVSKHVVEAGGKRMRPVMCLLAAKACGADDLDKHRKLAAIIEMPSFSNSCGREIFLHKQRSHLAYCQSPNFNSKRNWLN